MFKSLRGVLGTVLSVMPDNCLPHQLKSKPFLDGDNILLFFASSSPRLAPDSDPYPIST